MKFLIILVALIFFQNPASGFAKESGQCDSETTQQGMNACAGAEYAKADTAMNALYKRQMSRLSKAGKAGLREAQRSWVIFRDKSCLYEVGRQQDGGSIWPLQQALCLTAKTRQRIEDLNRYIACTQDGCPN